VQRADFFRGRTLCEAVCSLPGIASMQSIRFFGDLNVTR